MLEGEILITVLQIHFVAQLTSPFLFTGISKLVLADQNGLFEEQADYEEPDVALAADVRKNQTIQFGTKRGVVVGCR